MADEKTAPSTPPKKVKKALPESPEQPPAHPELPMAQAIRTAKKAELVAWCETFDLDAEGKVDDLRKRVAEYVSAQKKTAPLAAPPEAPAKEEEAAPLEKPVKVAPKRPAKEPEKEEAVGEAEEYEPKAKPKLDPRLQRLLAIRVSKTAARPAFPRQEWFRYKKFADEWRKPQGGQSKLRRHFGYRWNLPSVGYRGPREVRGLHPSGFQEVLVHNERQLEGLNPAIQAVRIAHAVGARKRELIEKVCDDKGLRVLNRMVTE
jgi:large subunit ribosomal protein L32e